MPRVEALNKCCSTFIQRINIAIGNGSAYISESMTYIIKTHDTTNRGFSTTAISKKISSMKIFSSLKKISSLKIWLYRYSFNARAHTHTHAHTHTQIQDVPAQKQNVTYNGHSRSLEVMYFGITEKATRA